MEVIALRTRVLGPVLAWSAAVVSVVLITSFGIDVAGQQLIRDPAELSLAGASVAVTEPAAVSTTGSDSSPTDRRTASKSGANSTGILPSAGSTGGPTEGAVTQEHASGAAIGSYATVGGRVRVRCDGAGITLGGGYAQPTSSWSVQLRNPGPDQIRVRFERRDHRALLVIADCQAGRPRFGQRWLDAGQNGDPNDGQNDGQNDGHGGGGWRTGGGDGGVGRPTSSPTPSRTGRPTASPTSVRPARKE